MKKIISNGAAVLVCSFLVLFILAALFAGEGPAYASSGSGSKALLTKAAFSKMLQGRQAFAVSSQYGIKASVSLSNAKGKLRIKATAASGDTILGVGVALGENYVYKKLDINSRTFDKTISVKSYDPGYYGVYILTNKSYAAESFAYYKTNIGILTDKPTYKGVFNVFAKKINYYPYTVTFANAAHNLYFEYRLKGKKKWKRKGYMRRDSIKLATEQGYAIKKLKANRRYQTRIRYGVVATKSNGQSGIIYGPAKNTGTYKMGKAGKPKVKSIKVKAVKIKFHKNRVAGHYEWTGYSYIWIKPYTEKFYTCKYKVTVKLKKKPGTKGLWVEGKYIKGNKKTYKATFTPYPNYFVKRPPKGLKKVKVRVKSYQSKKYGGFSPTKSRRVKVK